MLNHVSSASSFFLTLCIGVCTLHQQSVLPIYSNQSHVGEEPHQPAQSKILKVSNLHASAACFSVLAFTRFQEYIESYQCSKTSKIKRVPHSSLPPAKSCYPLECQMYWHIIRRNITTFLHLFFHFVHAPCTKRESLRTDSSNYAFYFEHAQEKTLHWYTLTILLYFVLIT